MSVDHLAQAAIQAFATRQEVREIFCFGSYSQGSSDRYSDLDLQVVTDAYALSLHDLVATVRTIDEPLVLFPLFSQPEQAAFTILFRSYPLYQKLDLGIQQRTIPVPFADATSVYRRERSTDQIPVTQNPCSEMDWMTTLSPRVRVFYDRFLGATRYTKYRKRGQPLTAYKFYRSLLSSFLGDAYCQLTEKVTSESELGLLEYQALDRTANAAVVKYLYPGDESHMNALIVEILSHMLSQAHSQIEPLHAENLSVMLQFVAQELDVSLAMTTLQS
jgi:predicted nucleotidyltransferase